MDTNLSLYEIEIAIAKHDTFNFIRNIIAFNVNGTGEVLNIGHECDMLVLSKSGYLTEIEIKRSWTDFLADFKKKHSHESPLIKYFYYAVPESLYERVMEYLYQKEIFAISGIITYSEDGSIQIRNAKYYSSMGEPFFCNGTQLGGRKLYLEERLQVARYGAMRTIMLKEKIIKLSVKPQL